MSAVISGFITRMTAAAAKKAWKWVMAEDWARTFAKEIKRVSRTKVRVRRIESWLLLPETKDALAAPTETKLADIFASLKVALRPRVVIRKERYKAEQLDPIAIHIFETALDQFLVSLSVSEEIKIVHERESAQLNEIRGLLTDDLPDDMSDYGLPPNSAVWLKRAHAEAREETNRVLNSFRSQPGQQQTVLQELLDPVVQWLDPGSPSLLVALGTIADSFNLPSLSGRAYELAARNGAPDRLRWIAAAALSLQHDRDSDRYSELVDVLTEGDLSPIPRAILAYLNGDLESILGIDFTDLTADARALMHRFRAHVHEVAGNADRAIEEVEAGVLVASAPGSLALHLANSLLHRAVTAGGVAATQDKRRVVELAIEVRDQRRRWGGPSYEASKVAAQAALSLQEATSALDFAAAPPFGEATPAEANKPELLEVAAQAALAIDHEEALDALVPRLDGFEAKWIAAERAMRAGDRVAAQGLLNEAFPLADDAARRWAVQQAMADAGKWPIPEFEELERTSPLQAALVRTQSSARRGDIDAAERAVRPFITTSAAAAQLLAELQHENGQPELSARTLTDAHDRFNMPELLVGAALMFEAADQLEASRSAAERAIAHLPPGASKRRAARSLLIRLAAQRNDFRALALETQALIEDGDEDPKTRRLLAQALSRSYRFEEAWQVLRLLDPPPVSSDQDVHLWLTLVARFAREPEFVTSAIDVVRASDSEDIRGHGLLAILAVTNRVVVSETVGQAVNSETERFLNDFPDTQIIRRITFRDVDELFERLAPELSRGADQYQVLVEKVATGQAPFGLLAAFAGKPYAEALLRRAAGCLPVIKPFADELTQENRALRSALDGRVVIETSALHAMALLQDQWLKVRQLFKEITFPVPSRADVVEARGQLEMRSTMSVGWDSRSNRAIVNEISDEELDLLIERAAWMDEESQNLELTTIDQLEHFRDLDDDGFRAWLAPVDVAITSGAVLYSDDPILRVLARDAGAIAFGTGALLNYLSSEHAISPEQLRGLRSTLLENYVVDLMPSIVELDELATKEEWSLGAAAFNVSRDLFWTGRQDAFKSWIYLAQRVKVTNSQAIAGWFMVATIGALKSIADVRVKVAAELLVRTCLLIEADPDDFLLALHGVRRGLVEGGETEDPLRLTVEILLSQESLGPMDVRAQYASTLFSSLSDEDRSRAMRFLLGLD